MGDVKIPRLFLLLLASSAIFAACGVRYSDPPLGNEFFTSLVVTGDMRARQPLTGLLSFKQRYPTEVLVRCELRQGKDFIRTIGDYTAPAHPSGGAKATPFPGSYSYDFTIDTPGAYKFECFTPADEDNYIIKEITIGRAPDVAPTPIPNADLPSE